MLAQMTVSAQAGEVLIYSPGGTNVLGGNFALVGLPSVGASGAIFGTTAIAWIDLLAHWRYHPRPGTRLAWLIVELIVGIGLGFIPYVDNFAHLGGLLMGLLMGMAFYPIISPSTRHRAIVIGFRLAAIPIAIVLFVVLIRNFYKSDPYAACTWCRYLSCIPTSANDHCQGTAPDTAPEEPDEFAVDSFVLFLELEAKSIVGVGSVWKVLAWVWRAFTCLVHDAVNRGTPTVERFREIRKLGIPRRLPLVFCLPGIFPLLCRATRAAHASHGALGAARLAGPYALHLQPGSQRRGRTRALGRRWGWKWKSVVRVAQMGSEFVQGVQANPSWRWWSPSTHLHELAYALSSYLGMLVLRVQPGRHRGA
ncbi:predicted protein [Postia placenta Mad-698-R]|nr:predicted protein [Postia placenta Mad-698-R]